jgi:hypothetical protein
MAQAVAVRRVAKGDWIKPRPRLVRIMVAGDPRCARGSPDVRASLPLFAVMTSVDRCQVQHIYICPHRRVNNPHDVTPKTAAH